MERFNPLNDYLFLKLMGEEGDEVQCLAFLNAVLGSKSLKPVTLIKILENKTFTAELIGEKSGILDVRVETDTGEKINIEVQLRDMQDMEQRTLFYWGREYTKAISSGGRYKDLPKVITINIVNFDKIKLEDFHTCYHLWEDMHHEYLLTDVLEIHFINMVKFRKFKSIKPSVCDAINNPLERWLSFFDQSTSEEELKEIMKMDSAISKAQERMDFVTQDKEFMSNYIRREMAILDLNSIESTAFEKGIEKTQLEIAKNLLKKGLGIDFIHETTGLDTETIQTLDETSKISGL